MRAYQYIALKKSGQSCKGVIEADSERNARQLIRAQGLIPMQIHALAEHKLSKHKNKLSANELTLLTRQLATLLSAGIPVEEALQGVVQQSKQDKARQVMIGVRANVMGGYSLAQSMSEYPLTFPELYRATIAAGEQTGRLDLVLEKLADYTENQQKIRQKVQQAMIYPSVMILITITVISFLLTFVVPEMIGVFKDSGQNLPTMTVVLIYISHGIKAYGLYGLLSILCLLMVGIKSLKNPLIKQHWHKLVLQIPIFGHMISSINIARYSHTFSILFAAGVSVLDTMRVSASVLSNIKMQMAFATATLQVKEGSGISAAVKETGFLSPMAIHLIASGEKSGQLPNMMARAAQHLDHDVSRAIDTGLTLLEPVIILLMGAVVMFIVLATLLPVFSMQQLIT